MSMTWHSVLIPTRVDFAPKPSQLVTFITACEKLGAFGAHPTRHILNFDNAEPAFEARNPKTGEVIKAPSAADRIDVKSTAQFASRLAGITHWAAVCDSDVVGPHAPFAAMHVTNDQRINHYPLTLKCEAHGRIVSMSDLHDEATPNRRSIVDRLSFWKQKPTAQPSRKTTPPFAEPCDNTTGPARYAHPHDEAAVLEVPNAACASFHIEFSSGNWAFPPRDMSSLDLIQPPYVEAARSAFGIDFLQGCHWG